MRGEQQPTSHTLRRIAVELSRLEVSGQKVAVIIMNRAAAQPEPAPGSQESLTLVGQTIVDQIREASTAAGFATALENVQLLRPDATKPVTAQVSSAITTPDTPPLTVVECSPLRQSDRRWLLSQPNAETNAASKEADRVRYFFLEFAVGDNSNNTTEPLGRWEPGVTVYLNGGEPPASLVQLAIYYLQRVLSTATGVVPRL